MYKCVLFEYTYLWHFFIDLHKNEHIQVTSAKYITAAKILFDIKFLCLLVPSRTRLWRIA